MTPRRVLRHADVFCRVVDNLGDAGVCWRLARQLAREHGLAVRLYIDQPEALARIGAGNEVAWSGARRGEVARSASGRMTTAPPPATAPAFVTATAPMAAPAPIAATAPMAAPAAVTMTAAMTMTAAGPGHVAVLAWPDPWPPDAPTPADLVIAAFACRLPEPYLDAMAARAQPPAWFNLEYLSAEDWVADAHGLASPRPDRPLAERFFFPGFEARTGGLLRERGLIERRDAFAVDPRAQAALCAMLGIAPRQGGETLVSVFCYPHAPLEALLTACRDGDQPVRMLLPEGVGRDAFGALFGEPPIVGVCKRQGMLQVDVVPLVPQPRYDELLWMSDLNFVRGEDSFVRAQWAGKPFVWHVYPQDQGADRIKLDAFLARYLNRTHDAGAPADAAGVTGAAAAADAAGAAAAAGVADAAAAADATSAMMRAWNGDGVLVPAWRGLLDARAAATALAARWCDALATQVDLAEKLVWSARNML